MKTSYIIRISKIIIVLTIGFLALAVVFGNITDYYSNFYFVQHVMSMNDKKSPLLGQAITYRAITSSALHHFAYICVIATETLIMLFAFKGSFDMWRARKESLEAFHQAKRYGIVSLILCCLLWFFGFQVVAGEWFAMWMSNVWNGLPSAFRLVTYMSVALVYLSLKNDD